jgi:hypothetical protein
MRAASAAKRRARERAKPDRAEAAVALLAARATVSGMAFSTRWHWIVGSMWLSLGCGPGAGDEGDATGTTEAATSADASTQGDATDSTGGPPGDACDPIRPDDAEGQPVVITLRNDRAEPIFVGYGNECVLQAYELLAPDGTALDPIGPTCTQSCAEVIESGCQAIDCGACGGPELVRLEPGGTWELEWSGVLRPGLEIPEACASSPECDGGCAGRRLPQAGEHVVRSIAFVSCTSDAGTPCDACADGETACTVYAGFGSDFSTPDFTAEAGLDVPSASTVELVFDP